MFINCRSCNGPRFHRLGKSIYCTSPVIYHFSLILLISFFVLNDLKNLNLNELPIQSIITGKVLLPARQNAVLLNDTCCYPNYLASKVLKPAIFICNLFQRRKKGAGWVQIQHS